MAVNFIKSNALIDGLGLSFNETILAQTETERDFKLILFEKSISGYAMPDRFSLCVHHEPHPLSLLAAGELQVYLGMQQEWTHNFGLADGLLPIIGKMFGVLVVVTVDHQMGYLAAFSGKLAGGNHHGRFVPPIFDGTADGGFLNAGMDELTRMNEAIRILEAQVKDTNVWQVCHLKALRKSHSVALQNEIFDQYSFLNQAGEEKGLREIFDDAFYKNPPAGAGECAAPKLLQYAFQNNLRPLAMAEFWWGLSPKSAHWKHGQFYPVCREKCVPILAHMLAGIA